MTDPLPGKPLGFKAYAIGGVVFNTVLALAMYLAATVFQWGALP